MPLPFILAGVAAAAIGYGAKKGYDGYQDKSDAEDIQRNAQRAYNAEKEDFDLATKESGDNLDKLGDLQLEVGKKFAQFKTLIDELLEKLNKASSGKDFSVNVPQHKLDQIADLSLSATAYLGQLAGAAGAGAAAAYAVYGGVWGLAAASTGTPILTLSGAAASNATMAAIGGGPIAAGGFGMAGGSMVLGGLLLLLYWLLLDGLMHLMQKKL